jgi:hypothetical protein
MPFKFKKSRVIVPHSKYCYMKNNEHPFSGVIKGSFYGSRAANKNTAKGNDYLWYEVGCNDVICKAIKAVHSSVLKEV